MQLDGHSAEFCEPRAGPTESLLSSSSPLRCVQFVDGCSGRELQPEPNAPAIPPLQLVDVAEFGVASLSGADAAEVHSAVHTVAKVRLVGQTRVTDADRLELMYTACSASLAAHRWKLDAKPAVEPQAADVSLHSSAQAAQTNAEHSAQATPLLIESHAVHTQCA